ncbi:hypothetical protein VPH35_026445 [Triticum aestivum]
MQPYYHCLGGDRLSALPDTALVRVLSHLSSNEVARACALSRRWRHALAAVPVVDLVDPRARRARGVAGPIRALRLLTVDPPVGLLDQWIGVVIGSGVEEVDVELRCPYISRRRLCPFWSDKSSADFDAVYGRSYTKTPPLLFRCRTLRRLRLTSWTLELPSGFDVGVFAASLQTLCLKRIMAANEVILQLLYGCPLLADLTLEECPGATEITVPSDRLRSFAMVCCHKAQRVVLYTPCLRSLRYKGGLPPHTSFLLVAGYESVAAVTMDICEDLSSKSPTEVAPLMGLVSWCRNLTYLHLALRPSMAYYCSEFMAVPGRQLGLRQLVLKGLLGTEHAVRNLQVLSLFPVVPEPRKPYYSYDDSDEDEPENCGIVEEAVDYDQMTKNLWWMHIPCLDHSLRRISIEKYSGNAFDRIVAQFLVTKAAALEEFSVTLSAPLSPQKEEIATEFRSWLRNPYAVVTCK